MLLPTIVLGVLLLAVVGYFLFAPTEKEVVSARKMLVVLPFENLGPPEDDYFAAGITDAVTARLAGIHGMGVIARQSAIQYKNSTKTIQLIGKELGVDYVLGGTAQRERPSDPTSRIRVIPQLIQVSDATHLWADTYDEDMAEVFRVQSDIAERVARALDITLIEPERRTLSHKPTENLEAYNYYLQGKVYAARSTLKKDAEIAVQLYEKAVELDPSFVVAYAALSRARIWLRWNFGQIDQAPKAKEAIEKAQQLAPDLAATHLALGYYYYWGSRDYDKAMEHFTIVQRRQPNETEVIGAIGYIRRRQGKWDQAVAQLEKAVALDPRNYSFLISLGQTYFFMRQYVQAERYLNRAISVAPDIPRAYNMKVALYLNWDGRTERALQVLEDASGSLAWDVLDAAFWRLDIVGRNYGQALMRTLRPPDFSQISDKEGPILVFESSRVLGSGMLLYYIRKVIVHDRMKQTLLARAYADSARIFLESAIKDGEANLSNPVLHSDLGVVYAKLGRNKEAIQEGEKAVARLPVSKDAKDATYSIKTLAWIYTMVGEYDAAIDQLEYLLSIPSIITVPGLGIDPVWDPLREHGRFKRLLKKYGGESL